MSERISYNFNLIKNIVLNKYTLSALIIIFLLGLPVFTAVSIAARADAGNSVGRAGNFEIGAGFGTPSGLDARYYFIDKLAIDGLIGFSPGKNFSFSLDLIWEEFQLYRSPAWGSWFFFGLGTMFEKDDSSFNKNIRIPLGISLPLYHYPISFSFYVAPAIVVSGKNNFDLNYGIGIRYNFTLANAEKRRKESLEREVSRLGANVENLQEGLNTTKGKLAQTEGELSATRGKLSETEKKLGETTGKLNELTGTLGTIKNRLDIAEGELGSTKSKLQMTTQELDSAKNKLDYVQNELKNTKKTLDDRQVELNKKQSELDQSKAIIASNAFTAKEKKEEEQKVAEKQKALDEQVTQLSKQKKEWEKIKQSESQRREQLKKKCQDRGGVIDDDGYCTCPENQEWDFKTDKCVCVKGYYRNNPAEDCKPCEVIRENGNCTSGDCYENEEKVKLAKGPHKYVCVRKCRKSNEIWSKQKKTCVCREGYYRDENGDCVQRQ